MEKLYKGFEIKVRPSRGKDGGWLETSYTMVRKVDGWVVTDGFTHEPELVMVEKLKKLADELTDVVSDLLEGRPGARIAVEEMAKRGKLSDEE